MKILVVTLFVSILITPLYSQDLAAYSGANIGGLLINGKFKKMLIGINFYIYKKQTSPSFTGGLGAEITSDRKSNILYVFPGYAGFTSTYGEYAGAFWGVYYNPSYYILAKEDFETEKKTYYKGFCYRSFAIRTGVFYQTFSLTANYRFNYTKHYKEQFVSIGLEIDGGKLFESAY